MSNFEFFFYLFVYASILTYLVIGFIISFEAMLLLNEVPSAIEWVRKWHKASGFKTMLIIFLPMLQLSYLFLEWLPRQMGLSDEACPFDLDKIFLTAFPKGEV